MQIGQALKTWSLENNGHLPWEIGTNSGGTMEFCARAADGFESSAAIHFRALSNELSTPLILVCPKDRSRKPAATFEELKAENISYRLRSITNLSEIEPKQRVVVCPVDGYTLYSDGTVQGPAAENPEPNGPMHVK
jgi:hypothetical protein